MRRAPTSPERSRPSTAPGPADLRQTSPAFESPRRAAEAALQTAEDLIRALTQDEASTSGGSLDVGLAYFPPGSPAPCDALRRGASGFTPSADNRVKMAAAARALQMLQTLLVQERAGRAADKDTQEWRVRLLEQQIEEHKQTANKSSAVIDSKDEKQAASDYLIGALRRQLETEMRERYNEGLEARAKIQEEALRAQSKETAVSDLLGRLHEMKAKLEATRAELQQATVIKQKAEDTAARAEHTLESAVRAAVEEARLEASLRYDRLDSVLTDTRERLEVERRRTEELIRMNEDARDAAARAATLAADQLSSAMIRVAEMEGKVATAKTTVGALETKLEAKDALIDELTNDKATLASTLASERATHEDEILVMANRLRDRQALADDLTRQLGTAEHQVKVLRAERDEITKQGLLTEDNLKGQTMDLSKTVGMLKNEREYLKKRVEELELEYRELGRTHERQLTEIEGKLQRAWERKMEEFSAAERARADNALFQQRNTLRGEMNNREQIFKQRLDNELLDLRLQIEGEGQTKIRRVEMEWERKVSEERTRYERDLYTARALAREEVSQFKARLQHEHEEYRKVRHEAESYKLQLVELLAKLNGLERIMTNTTENLEQRRKDHEDYVNDLRTKQISELQTIQLSHGQKLTTLTLELERIKANAEANARRLMSQLREQTGRTQEAVKYLHEARAQVKALEADVHSLRETGLEVERAHVEEIAKMKADFDQVLTDINAQHREHVAQIRAAHAAEIAEGQRREAVLAKEKYHLERALDRKEPRPEDLLRIRQLEAAVHRAADESLEQRDKIKALKLEMLMREDTYTRLFSKGGQVETMAVANSMLSDDTMLAWMKMGESGHVLNVNPSFISGQNPGGAFASTLRAQTAPLPSTAGRMAPPPTSPRPRGLPSSPQARQRSPPSPRASVLSANRLGTSFTSQRMGATGMGEGSPPGSPDKKAANLHSKWFDRRNVMVDTSSAAVTVGRSGIFKKPVQPQQRPGTATVDSRPQAVRQRAAEPQRPSTASAVEGKSPAPTIGGPAANHAPANPAAPLTMTPRGPQAEGRASLASQSAGSLQKRLHATDARTQVAILRLQKSASEKKRSIRRSVDLPAALEELDLPANAPKMPNLTAVGLMSMSSVAGLQSSTNRMEKGLMQHVARLGISLGAGANEGGTLSRWQQASMAVARGGLHVTHEDVENVALQSGSDSRGPSFMGSAQTRDRESFISADGEGAAGMGDASAHPRVSVASSIVGSTTAPSSPTTPRMSSVKFGLDPLPDGEGQDPGVGRGAASDFGEGVVHDVPHELPTARSLARLQSSQRSPSLLRRGVSWAGELDGKEATDNSPRASEASSGQALDRPSTTEPAGDGSRTPGSALRAFGSTQDPNAISGISSAAQPGMESGRGSGGSTQEPSWLLSSLLVETVGGSQVYSEDAAQGGLGGGEVSGGGSGGGQGMDFEPDRERSLSLAPDPRPVAMAGQVQR